MKAFEQGIKDGRRPGAHRGIVRLLKKIYNNKKSCLKVKNSTGRGNGHI